MPGPRNGEWILQHASTPLKLEWLIASSCLNQLHLMSDSQVNAPGPFTANGTVTWDQTATHKTPHTSGPSGGPMTGRPDYQTPDLPGHIRGPRVLQRVAPSLDNNLTCERGVWNFIGEIEQLREFILITFLKHKGPKGEINFRVPSEELATTD